MLLQKSSCSNCCF